MRVQLFGHETYYDPDNLLNTAIEFNSVGDSFNPSTHS
jgi:hypothetical protein